MRAAIIGLASAAAVAFAPAAQAQANPFQNIPITGTSKAGPLNGTFSITNFVAKDGRVWAVGTLVGTLAGQAVNQTISLPVRGARTANEGQGHRGDDETGGFGGFGALTPERGTRPASFSPATPLVVPAQTAVCQILFLDLGPLDLNLLGLRVQLNEVILQITAQQGAGQLLGNLLCAVVNLLNGINFNGLLAGLVANLLNAIQAIVNNLLAGIPV